MTEEKPHDPPPYTVGRTVQTGLGIIELRLSTCEEQQ